LDRYRTDQDRLAFGISRLDFPAYGLEFSELGLEYQIVMVGASHRLVRRNGDDMEAVDFVEFFGRGCGRSGHASKLLIQPEIILECDGSESLRLLLDGHALFGFDRLMKSFRPPPARL